MWRNASIAGSWASILAAMLAWGGVVSFAWTILEMQVARAALSGDLDQAAAKQTVAARARALARETTEERVALERSARVDVLSAVNTIESVGVSAGVTVHVSDARTESSIAGNPGGLTLSAIGFVVTAEGTFTGLMRALLLLETLPLPTVIEEVELARPPIDETSGNVPWHLNVRLRLLTTANISS